MSPLKNISPIDGRYWNKTNQYSEYFSESALIKYRVMVEIAYFIKLSTIKDLKLPLSKEETTNLENIAKHFTQTDAQKVKEIEKVTNHDVKAVEYFIKEQLETLGLSKYKEFVHFGLTSQDINNTAIPISIKDALDGAYIPELKSVIAILEKYSIQWKQIPMLAKTHGQPASPTTLGKEFFVFVERLKIQLLKLENIELTGKFGGATGNLNAHKVSYPKLNWKKIFNEFLSTDLRIKRQQTTTQIEHYDGLAELFQVLGRINTILIDLSRDLWTYISMDYFKQKIKKGEIGSSAMPHKVNPIDFENAEGNMGIANALFTHLAQKLPISRLQRDLTDSTVLRNVGVPFAHTSIALQSIEKGLNKLIINQPAIANDLSENYIVVAEAIQNILRREGLNNPYEMLKDLTRNHKIINQSSIEKFINSLELNESIKDELKAIKPNNYTGYEF